MHSFAQIQWVQYIGELNCFELAQYLSWHTTLLLSNFMAERANYCRQVMIHCLVD